MDSMAYLEDLTSQDRTTRLFSWARKQGIKRPQDHPKIVIKFFQREISIAEQYHAMFSKGDQ